MKILELSILSNNLLETKNFYSSIPGFKVLDQTDTNLSLKAGNTTLNFQYIYGVNPVYHFAFNIPCNQLEKALNLIAKHTEILRLPETDELISDFKNWNARSFYFNDNNGNILECIARHDLHNEQKIWNEHDFILNISEFGFVVENVIQAQNFLSSRGIPLFEKGPQLADFSVLGTDTGLILLTDMDRGWKPHNIEPQPFWSKLEILNGKNRLQLNFSDRLQII
ncbi:MAG: hypothetical protein ABI390_01335 [Daejeonella sp.]